MPRKEKKFHFIYKTTNTITGRYYYGMHSTSNLDDKYLGSGRRLRHSINKYGENAHQREILEFFDTREDLANREKEIINLNEIAKDECMNLQLGGGGGFISAQHQLKCSLAGTKAAAKSGKNKERLKWLRENDEIWRKRKSEMMSKSKLGNTNLLGYKHTKEAKRKIGKANSKSQSGSKNSQYGTMWIHNKKLKQNKKIFRESLIPEGWELGRILKF